MHIVMYDGEQEQIKDYLESITEKHSAHIILIKEDLSHIYAIQEALANNAFVCMHADRFLEGNKTISAVFMNEEARFPAGPFLLARTFHLAGFICFRDERPSFRLSFLRQPPQSLWRIQGYFHSGNVKGLLRCNGKNNKEISFTMV